MAVVEVIIGKLGRAHGIRGEIGVQLLTDEPNLRFASGTKVQLEGQNQTLTVKRLREHNGKFLVSFEELSDRTAAEQLVGAVLIATVAETELPTGEDEYFDRQLVGLRAFVGAEAVGEVIEVLHLPVQDLLVISTKNGERMIPFVKEIVPEIDLEAGTVQIVDRPGLLDDLEAEVAEGDNG